MERSESEIRWDVFLSYRREHAALARLIKKELRVRKFTVFLDVDELGSGRFDENLLQNIQKSSNFVLVLTPKALDPCLGDKACKDWVHKEIKHALRFNCNIIPIIGDGFTWPDTKALPKDIQKIPLCNGIKWNHEYPKGAMNKLKEFMKTVQRAGVNARNNPQSTNSLTHRNQSFTKPRQMAGGRGHFFPDPRFLIGPVWAHVPSIPIFSCKALGLENSPKPRLLRKNYTNT